MTATATQTITHAFVLRTAEWGVDVETLAGRRLGRTVEGRDKRTTATEVREYATYGLFRDGIARRFALVNGAYVELCKRCDGTGSYPSSEWHGICFGCSGTGQSDKWFGTVTLVDKAMVTWGRGVRTASNKAQAKYDARQAEIAAWRDAHTDLVTWVNALVPTETIEIDGWQYGHAAGTVLTQENFTQFGTTAAPMIDSVRQGGDLSKGETAYLTKVMESATTRAANDTSRYAGDVKAKVTMTGTVSHVKGVEGVYGFSLLIIVTGTGADEGITVKTYTTSKTAESLESGDAVTVSATVKGHETFACRKTTVITRAKFAKI